MVSGGILEKIIFFGPVLLFLFVVSNLSYLACFSCVCCLAIGYQLTSRFIFGAPSFMDLSQLILHQDNNTPAEASFDSKSDPQITTHNSTATSTRPYPWKDLFIPESIDRALEEFLNLTLTTYIDSWYLPSVSDHQTFLLELRYHLRYILTSLYKRIEHADLAQLILEKAVPVGVSHADIYSKIRRHFGHKATAETLEQRVLDYLRPTSLHIALYSRSSELTYLRTLAEYLMTHFADERRLAGWNLEQIGSNSNKLKWCQNPRYFVRELLVFAILLPVLDVIAEPDTINDLLILLFDPEPIKIFDDPPSKLVPMLGNFTELTSNDGTPDSLLKVKLESILNDSKLLYLFTNYLKETSGPLHYLQFALSAFDIQNRLRQEKLSNSGLSKEDFAHIHWEAWELYKNYVHEASLDHIEFDVDLCEQFGVAVETQNTSSIEKVLTMSNDIVCHRLEYQCMTQFFQSEVYFDYLTGDRPQVRLEIRDHKGNKVKPNRLSVPSNTSDGGFTLAKFRNRFLGVFGTSVEEGVFLTADGKIKSSAFPVDWGDDAVFETSDGRSLPDSTEDLDEDIIIQPDCVDDSEDESLELRDINCWKVTVPKIEPRRDPQGRAIYVYIVEIERNDIMEGNPRRQWTVDRRYNEFYILESKLLEFHGEHIVTPLLPTQKRFVNKNRAFVESSRPAFEGFLQRLVDTKILKASGLLYAFLTSNEEFTQNFLRINPWSAMKKVPAKLSRERGQNMKHYLDQFLASALNGLPEMKITKSVSKNLDLKSEGSGTSSVSFALDKNLVRDKVYGTLFRNNCGLVPEEAIEAVRTSQMVAQHYVPVTTSTYDLILVLGAKVIRASRWLFAILVSMRFLFRDTTDTVLRILLGRVLRIALHELRVVRLIELLGDVLFYREAKVETENDRRKRADQARLMTKDFLTKEIPQPAIKAVGHEKLCHGTDILFDCLQHPRLNKQLTYVLLDLLLKEICPEIENM